MGIERFFFDDLCIVPDVVSSLEGYAIIRSGPDWTIDRIYLRHINGAMHPTDDPRLFSLIEEALERDFSADITGQCGTELDGSNARTVRIPGIGNAA